MWEEMVGGFPPPQCLALPHQQRVREILSLYPPRKETPIRVLQKGKQGKQGKQFNADRHFSEVATETKGKQTRNRCARALPTTSPKPKGLGNTSPSCKNPCRHWLFQGWSASGCSEAALRETLVIIGFSHPTPLAASYVPPPTPHSVASSQAPVWSAQIILNAGRPDAPLAAPLTTTYSVSSQPLKVRIKRCRFPQRSCGYLRQARRAPPTGGARRQSDLYA